MRFIDDYNVLGNVKGFCVEVFVDKVDVMSLERLLFEKVGGVFI